MDNMDLNDRCLLILPVLYCQQATGRNGVPQLDIFIKSFGQTYTCQINVAYTSSAWRDAISLTKQEGWYNLSAPTH